MRTEFSRFWLLVLHVTQNLERFKSQARDDQPIKKNSGWISFFCSLAPSEQKEYSKNVKTRTKAALDQYSSGKYNTKHPWRKLCHHLQRNIRCSCLFSARQLHHRLLGWWGKHPPPEQGRKFPVTFGNEPLVTIQFCAREEPLLSHPASTEPH